MTIDPEHPLAFARKLNLLIEGNELDALLQLDRKTRRLGINSVAYNGVAAICMWRLFATQRAHIVIPVSDLRDGASIIFSMRAIAGHVQDNAIRESLYFHNDFSVIYRDHGGSHNVIEHVPYGWLDHKAKGWDAPLTVAFWDFERAPGKAVHDALNLASRPVDLVVLNHPHGVSSRS